MDSSGASMTDSREGALSASFEGDFVKVGDCEEEEFISIHTPAGADTEGNTYDNIDEMWEINLKKSESPGKWYGDAKSYWENVAPTVEGMLGGYAHISGTDAVGSTKFLNEFIKGPNPKVQSRVALDCGAGIGRVTKKFLLPLFDIVDLVEQCQAFLDRAKDYVGSNRVENYICKGLQEFTPEKGRYDVIWCQWVLGHLTDDDLVSFFRRCKEGLAENGIICVKENLTKEGFLVDKEDSSVTRSDELLKDLFERAGLTLLKEETQKKFPKEIFKVKMYALQ
eukprot:Nk52_evm9s293 gene=Nk52_evmTU9s293